MSLYIKTIYRMISYQNVGVMLFTGILMYIAWVFFVGLTTVITRYYKTDCGARKMIGNKVWLQVCRNSVHWNRV